MIKDSRMLACPIGRRLLLNTTLTDAATNVVALHARC
jgi:hypothetical protein